MPDSNIVVAEDLKKISISVYDSFSDFLMGSDEEKKFSISLLDVVRFAGHACPSMVGAFFIVKTAVEILYPENKICLRGDIRIDIPKKSTDGATGPIANVFGFITGAWSETGFGGLGGKFVRRNLIQFNSDSALPNSYRFTSLSNNKSVDIFFDPSRLALNLDPDEPFQQQWRRKIEAIMNNPQSVIRTSRPEASLDTQRNT